MEGKVETDAPEHKYVTILIQDNAGEIEYIQQFDLDKNGSYKAKLELLSDERELKYSVREATGAAVVVDAARVTSSPIAVDLKLVDSIS